MRPEHDSRSVKHRGDVQILVRVDPTDHNPARCRQLCHAQLLGRLMMTPGRRR